MTGPVCPTDPSAVFFWARSGGGHRTAKEGIKEQKIREYHAKGMRLDTQNDIDITGNKVLSSIRLPFLGGLGDMAVNAWDNAQKNGNLSYLQRHAALGWIVEIIMYPLVYFRVKWLLQDLKVEPEFVVSTQAFCINAIVSAMHTVNQEKKWNMHMHIHLTDLPSKKAVHFFPSIRKLANNDVLRNMVTLHAAAPITKNGQTESEFWEKYIGKIKVISSEQFPIQKAFIHTAELKKNLEQPVSKVKIKLNHPEEADIIRKGSFETKATFDEKEAAFDIKKEDKLAFLMLGSMPTTEAVLDWVHTFAEESKRCANEQRQHYFFLYCGKPSSDQEPNVLLPQINDALEKLKNAGKLAPNFTLVPFSYQSDDVIAFLMARSDMSITRSGGITSMQLLELDKADLPKREGKQILIHSEAQLFQKTTAQDSTEFVNSISTAVATHMANKRLATSPEWSEVRQKMHEQCLALGYSKDQSTNIVDNVIDLYLYNDAKGQTPSLVDLFKNLEQNAELLSTKSAKKSIEEQMQKMQQKESYKALDLSSLRDLAIQSVLIKEGIVLWEGGNAKYLCKKIGAKITSPLSAKNLINNSFFN